MNNKMDPSELKACIHSFLKEHKDAALATVMNDIPRCSPVQYFIGDNLNIYIISAGGDKFNAINQNSSVCLLVNTEYMNYRKIKGVQIFGQAITNIQDQRVYEEAQRYCPDEYIMEKEKASIKVIKIVPDEIVYLNSLEDGNRTKLVLRNNEIIEMPERELEMAY